MGFGLIAAGMVSGLGQGLSKGIDDYNRYRLYTDLDQARQAAENLRQERALEAQSKHQSAAFSHDDKARSEGYAHTMQVHKLDNELQSLRMDKQFGHDETMQKKAAELQSKLQDERLLQEKEIADNTRQMHKDLSSAQLENAKEIARMHIAAEANQGTLAFRDDGSAAYMTKTGEIKELIDPKTGETFRPLKAVTEDKVLIGKVVGSIIDSNDRVMMNPTTSDEMREQLRQKNERLLQGVVKMLGPQAAAAFREPEKSLIQLNPDQQKKFLEDNADRLAAPGAMDRAAAKLREQGVDPSFLGQGPSVAPTAPAKAPSPTAPAPDTSAVPGFASHSGGLVTVPAPSPKVQQEMSDAMGIPSGPVSLQTGMPVPSPTGIPEQGALPATNVPPAPPVETAPPTPAPQGGGVINTPAPAPVPTPAPTQQFEPPAPQALTPKDMMELMNKDEKLAIANMVERIRKPAINERPVTQQELHDYLMKIFGPWYARNNQSPKDLITDVNDLMQVLLPPKRS